MTAADLAAMWFVFWAVVLMLAVCAHFCDKIYRGKS